MDRPTVHAFSLECLVCRVQVLGEPKETYTPGEGPICRWHLLGEKRQMEIAFKLVEQIETDRRRQAIESGVRGIFADFFRSIRPSKCDPDQDIIDQRNKINCNLGF